MYTKEDNMRLPLQVLSYSASRWSIEANICLFCKSDVFFFYLYIWQKICWKHTFRKKNSNSSSTLIMSSMYFTAYNIKHMWAGTQFLSALEKSHQLMNAHMHSMILRVSEWWEVDIKGWSVIFEVSFIGTCCFDIMYDGSMQNDGCDWWRLCR